MSALGPIGRLGRWSATHARWVFISWAIILVGLGFRAARRNRALGCRVAGLPARNRSRPEA